jgi:hypothetical protein
VHACAEYGTIECHHVFTTLMLEGKYNPTPWQSKSHKKAISPRHHLLHSKSLPIASTDDHGEVRLFRSHSFPIASTYGHDEPEKVRGHRIHVEPTRFSSLMMGHHGTHTSIGRQL